MAHSPDTVGSREIGHALYTSPAQLRSWAFLYIFHKSGTRLRTAVFSRNPQHSKSIPTYTHTPGDFALEDCISWDPKGIKSIHTLSLGFKCILWK